MDPSRRDVLKVGAVTVPTALAGCSDLPFVGDDGGGGGGGGKAGTIVNWLYAPDAFRDLDHYDFRLLSPKQIAKREDALPDAAVSGFESYLPTRKPLDFGLDEVNRALLMPSVGVLRADFNTSEFKNDLEDEDWDNEEEKIEGYALFTDEKAEDAGNSRMIGVKGDEIVGSTGIGDDDPEDVLETVIKTKTGEEDGYVDESNPVGAMAKALPADHYYVSPHAPTGESNPKRADFEGAVAWGVGIDVPADGDDATVTYGFAFEEADAVANDAVGTWASEALEFDDVSDPTTKRDLVATVRATVPVDELSVFDSVPTVQIPWRQFNFDEVNSGHSPSGTGPSTPIAAEWEYDIGATTYSSPSVVDGVAYVGSSDGNVYAVNVEDGSEAWTFSADEAVTSAPAVIGGTVYVRDGDGVVYAISADDGSETWRYEPGGSAFVDTGTRHTTIASITVANGTVYAGTTQQSLAAISADDGSEKWVYDASEAFSAPAVADGTVISGVYDGTVHAIDAGDGSEKWTLDLDRNAFCPPAIVDGTAYAATWGGKVLALDPASGEQQWSTRVNDGVVASPAVTGDRIYVADTSGTVTGLSPSGEQQWTSRLPSSIQGDPVVVGDTLYVPSVSGTLAALDPASGDERFRYDIGGVVYACPAVTGGRVVVPADNELYSLVQG